MLEKPLGPPSIRDPLLALCADRKIATQVHYWRRGDPAMQSLAGPKLTERIGRVQAAFGLYGGGLRNNGSHLIDLVRMLLGPVSGVRATTGFAAIPHAALSGDGSLNFVLELSSSQVAVQALDFRHYREVGLDIWGETGRLAIMQEGLNVTSYPVAENRGLENAREIATDRPVLLPAGSADAMPNLYGNLARAMNNGEPLISPPASAVVTERVIDALMESAKTGARVAVTEPAR
jgi:predicted dehydrogenase